MTTILILNNIYLCFYDLSTLLGGNEKSLALSEIF
jgi:hypothetical protein